MLSTFQRSTTLEGSSLPVDFTCSTDGEGLWSTHAREVKIKRLLISYVAGHNDQGEDLAEGDAPTFGELQIEFDTKSWDTDEHGLIYTDRAFEAAFAEQLMKLGFSKLATENVGYSEQGMQGDDYVSMDVGMVFLAEAGSIFKV